MTDEMAKTTTQGSEEQAQPPENEWEDIGRRIEAQIRGVRPPLDHGAAVQERGDAPLPHLNGGHVGPARLEAPVLPHARGIRLGRGVPDAE